MIIEIKIDDAMVHKIKEQVVRDIASSMSWDTRKKIEKMVENSFNMIDQSVISRAVTEVLVREHLGVLMEKANDPI